MSPATSTIAASKIAPMRPLRGIRSPRVWDIIIIPALTRSPEGACGDSLRRHCGWTRAGGQCRPTSGKWAVDGRFWLLQTFNGLSYGALLFLLGSGLSLIFGVMRIVNLAHGAYFLLGGYVALSVIWSTGSWALALPAAALAIAIIGLLMERIFLRPLGFDPLRQVLLTVGFAFLFQQAALDIWTGNNFDINPPEALTKTIVVGGLFRPLYRIVMNGTAAAIPLRL